MRLLQWKLAAHQGTFTVEFWHPERYESDTPFDQSFSRRLGHQMFYGYRFSVGTWCWDRHNNSFYFQSLSGKWHSARMTDVYDGGPQGRQTWPQLYRIAKKCIHRMQPEHARRIMYPHEYQLSVVPAPAPARLH
jgi:hypothetical protein